MAAAEVMDAADALMHNDFNRSAVHLLETCFAGEVTIVQSITNGALTQGLEAAQSVPWQAFSGLTLAISMLLMFLGWYLVRAVNLFGGLYIGASVSVFLLTFSAGTPLMGDCLAMISVVTVSSLLCAIICLVYRKSMYLVLGMIAGEIVGKFVYHLCLETTALVELVVVPYVPDGYNYAAFLAYRPSPNISGLHKDVQDFAMSKYLWAPLGAMLLLTLIGLLTQLACYNQMMQKRKREVPLN